MNLDTYEELKLGTNIWDVKMGLQTWDNQVIITSKMTFNTC